MKKRNSSSPENESIRTKMLFFIWILPILSLAIMTVITVIAVYFLEQDSSISPSRMIRIGITTVIVVVLYLISSFVHHYYCIRYMQIPVWRWIASGFKGEPNLPWMPESKIVKAKEKKDNPS